MPNIYFRGKRNFPTLSREFRKSSLAYLQQKIIACKKCPRLVRYIGEIKSKFPTYWCRPVPSFGDPNARILLIGLAPGRFGSNRTGRMFTGDASGDFLYPALYRAGLATQPKATLREDGLKLKDCYITAIARCAPPQNKPTPKELSLCSSYVEEELQLLKSLKVVIALGKIAHDYYLKIRFKKAGKSDRQVFKLSQFPFRHGAVYQFDTEPKTLIDSYHPSRQNTNTGKLTRSMFDRIFNLASNF